MNYNLLLQYLSELESGSWTQFRQALEYLADDDEELYRSVEARRLSMLGHVEFAFTDNLQWSICPPTLAWLPRQDQITAVLCGQRTEPLVENLQHQAQELNCIVEIHPQTEGADVVLVTVPSSSVGEKLAELIEVQSEPQAAERIAHCLPTLANYARLFPEVAEPIGYKMKKFDVAASRWKEVEESHKPGFYRYEYYRPEYRLKLNGRSLKVPRNVGLFLLLQHHNRSVLQYDSEKQTLTIPVHPRLPVLFARAATLCSGYLPHFDKKTYTYTYHQITPTVARYITSKLNQQV